MTGSIIGYDLNEKYCQISYYSEEEQEPKTLETVEDDFKIPFVLGKRGDDWSSLEMMRNGWRTTEKAMLSRIF